MAKTVKKPLTKNQIITAIAEQTNLSKKDVVSVLDAQLQLAYKESKVGFTFHGVGKLLIVNRKKRKGRNPATGEVITIPARRVLKFRISKVAKDAIL